MAVTTSDCRKSGMTLRCRRKSSSALPHLKRCSSASISSSAYHRSSSIISFAPTYTNSGNDTSPLNENSSSFCCFRTFLRFDSINLQSAACRNEMMLEAVAEEQNKSDLGGGCSIDCEDFYLEESELVQNISHFGVGVCFIPHRFHYTIGELEPYRKIGDPEMDDLLNFIAENKGVEFCGAFDDVVAYAAEAYKEWISSSSQSESPQETMDPLAQFYAHYHDNIPDWVDFDQIERGMDVFLTYLPAAGCALLYRSLIGGFSIPKIVQVLVSTRYLVPGNKKDAASIQRDRKRTVERVIDTNGFLASCFAPLGCCDTSTKVSAAPLRPGGRGWEAALRVRVLHAKVRRSLLMSRKLGVNGISSPQWEIDEYGVPINQEDMAATLLAFSANTLMGIETITGKPLPDFEQRDYLALWRYLGWLLGVDTPHTDELVDEFTTISSSNPVKSGTPLVPIDPCGPRKLQYNTPFHQRDNDAIIHSHATLESIILHLLYPGEGSRELVLHLLSSFGSNRVVSTDGFDSTTKPPLSFIYRSEICRKLVGGPLADSLGIPESTRKWSGWNTASFRNYASHIAVIFLVHAFLLFLRCYTLLPMLFPRSRSFFIWLHSYLEEKFLKLWQHGHAKRVNDANPRSSEGNSSSCPFSMIMTPKLKR